MNNEEMLTLQNEFLKIRILPAFGGKISSLRSARTGEEFLLPPLRGYRHVSLTAGFHEGDLGGFDECLPSVASCESTSGELPVPDHGDLWRSEWHTDPYDLPTTLHVDSLSRPLCLTRHARLDGHSLVLDYDLLNLSNSPTSWLWSAHPLLRIEEGDRIVLPDEIKEVVVEYSAAGVFEKNSAISWPQAQSSLGATADLSTVGTRDGATAHKLFARVGRSGWAGLYRKRTGQGLVLRFDPSALPFLGLWICSGAWPETGAEKQYTVALEPTTSNVDSLASAVQNGTARSLSARERCQWRLELQLLEASSPLSLEAFCASAIANASNPEPPA
jgi:Domain of unknown function (DUF5107)